MWTYLFVQIEKNLRSFGGYLSPTTERSSFASPLLAAMKILSQGSLLALSGERKSWPGTRLAGIRVDIGRVLPDQLQHLIRSPMEIFSNPTFSAVSV